MFLTLTFDSFTGTDMRRIREAGPGLEHFDQQPALPEAEWRAKYETYLRSPEWARKRLSILARAEGRCERCGGETPFLQVHHLNYARLGDERDTDLIATCKPCHRGIHRNGGFQNLVAIPQQQVEKLPDSPEMRARVEASKQNCGRDPQERCDCRRCKRVSKRRAKRMMSRALLRAARPT
jgi:hypothetical protein